MAKLFKTTFAETGDKTAVNNPADPSGIVTYQTGYGGDYSRPLGIDPLAKAIERTKLNQILYDITDAIKSLQLQGITAYDTGFSAAIGGYPSNSFVLYNGAIWFSLIDNNVALPGTDPNKWSSPQAPTPSFGDNTQKIATMEALQLATNGGDYKASVRVASTANIVSINGLLTIDGVTVAAGDRVLLKNQTTASQNGIYKAAAGAWSRAEDANTGSKFNSGAIIPVDQGAVNADTNWQVTNDGTVTIGTTGLTFVCIETKLFTGSNQSLAANGYQRLPGGLIIQWGIRDTGGQGTGGTINFPIAFPSALYGVFITDLAGASAHVGGQAWSSTESTLAIFQWYSTSSTISQYFVWFAIGR